MPLRALALAGACLVMIAAAAQPAAAQDNPVVVMQTSMGDITIELYQDRAPISVENFLQYVNDGFYAGTIFHRVIAGVHDSGRWTHRRHAPETDPRAHQE